MRHQLPLILFVVLAACQDLTQRLNTLNVLPETIASVSPRVESIPTNSASVESVPSNDTLSPSPQLSLSPSPTVQNSPRPTPFPTSSLSHSFIDLILPGADTPWYQPSPLETRPPLGQEPEGPRYSRDDPRLKRIQPLAYYEHYLNYHKNRDYEITIYFSYKQSWKNVFNNPPEALFKQNHDHGYNIILNEQNIPEYAQQKEDFLKIKNKIENWKWIIGRAANALPEEPNSSYLDPFSNIVVLIDRSVPAAEIIKTLNEIQYYPSVLEVSARLMPVKYSYPNFTEGPVFR
jgi:hypothetical protein